MPGQVDRKLRAERAHQAQLIAGRMHRDYMKESLGKVLPVLFETGGEDFSLGHSDTYLSVKVREKGLRGKLLPVLISGIEGDELTGKIV